ncbi:hypothetical protein HGRIS_013577 [Hohenbuehelia grisea]|uniref:ADF-H domain-containing protein n=1 Tax=Hohenbuehelia grisea TaxID=104357 RepID=A0ABR3IVX1_9AGAR
MSATTGISVTPELTQAFSSAIDTRDVRFVKVSIRNESLVHDLSVPIEGTFQQDLNKLQDLLEDKTPAYVLARLDEPDTDWLAVFYVPDSAQVRDKMLYAATRSSLLRSLGSSTFTDSLFATSKDDLTPESYAAHLKHNAAPQPLSRREQEMADVRAAERAASEGSTYRGSRERQNPLGNGLGLGWVDDVERAVKELGSGEGSRLIVITIDPQTELLQLASEADITVEELVASLPQSEPCYALFAWPHSHTNPPRREIVQIYSCPSSSPIKTRMLYSAGVLVVFLAVRKVLESAIVNSNSVVATRRLETSDPKELDEAFLVSELDLDKQNAGVATESGAPTADEKKPFAKPKGPARRR